MTGVLAGLAILVPFGIALALTWLSARHRTTDRRREPIGRDQR